MGDKISIFFWVYKIDKYIHQNKLLIIIFLITLLLRILYLSPWLEDWDSVQFTSALTDYSLVKHQPHPPGYILYILMGRFLNIFFRDGAYSLTLMSALFGSLAIFPLFYLTKDMFGKVTAFFAILIFVLTPVGWLISEVALTNIPGLFFLILLSFYIFNITKHKLVLFYTGFLSGIILGVRFTEIPIILGLFFWASLKLKAPKYFFILISWMTLGTAFWIIPLLFITGFKEFVDSYTWTANYILTHDTINTYNQSIIQMFHTRLNNLTYLLNIGFTIQFIVLSIIIFLIIVWKKKIKNLKYQFLLIWIISYSIPLFFVYNLEVTRYTLPLLPPLVILISNELINLSTKYKFANLLLVWIILSIFMQSYSQINRFHNTLPPTIAPISFVKNNFSEYETAIISSLTYRQFQYYAPQYKVFRAEQVDPQIKLDEKYVIIDYIGIKNEINALKNYQIIKSVIFTGDKDIFTRVNKVTLYILQQV